MPVKIKWLLEDRISYFRYEGDVTVDEVTEAARFGVELLEASSYPLIHSIQDGRYQTSFPTHIGSLLGSVRSSLIHPKMGWIVSVGVNNDLVRFSATLVTKITRTRYRMQPDMEATLAFLQQTDGTLPPLDGLIDPTTGTYLHHIKSE